MYQNSRNSLADIHAQAVVDVSVWSFPVQCLSFYCSVNLLSSLLDDVTVTVSVTEQYGVFVTA